MVLEKLSDLEEAQHLLGEFKDIRGTTVVNPKGEPVGTVDDLYMDPKQDKLAMVGISFGGVFGFGARHVLVPMDQIELVDEDNVRILTTPEIVNCAPECPSLEGADLMAYHDYWCEALERPKAA
jgi:sporulation protein YlmC with PRC-barrel domain